jgi:cobalt-zinc-cadmium efflux system protein
LTLVLTTAFGIAQVIGAAAFGSVALLTDAAHNLSDGLAVGLALVAAALAGRAASGTRTYGWGRAEILVALMNGVVLAALGLLLAVESAQRLADPPAVASRGVIVFGVLGLLANGIGVIAMHRAHSGQDLNLRGAMLHTAFDALGSAGVVLAGVLVGAFGWPAADPAIALVLSLLMIASSWSLIGSAVAILLERAPSGLDPHRIGRALCAVEGVKDVHDLHVWTITTGFDALSVHIVATAGTETHALLHRLEDVLREQFGLTHTTIQVDTDHATPLQIRRRGSADEVKPRTGPLTLP